MDTSALYRQKNRELIRLKNIAYRAANRDKISQYNNLRRCKKVNPNPKQLITCINGVKTVHWV